MTLSTFALRSVRYHWRSNVAVVLGAAVGTAALTGALIVGDSMRGSLSENAVVRLAGIDHALVAQKFFRAAVADEIQTDPEFADRFERIAPIILLRGAVTHAEKRTRADRVNIIGVDHRFWALSSPFLLEGVGRGEGESVPNQRDRSLILNEPLARELGAAVDDEVLVRMGKPSPIATETLLGRRDETVSTLRLPVSAVVPPSGLGGFSLSPTQGSPKNVYVPLDVLQRTIDRPARVNALLSVAKAGTESGDAEAPDRLRRLLQAHVTLEDLGLRLRVDEEHGYVSLESESLLIDPAIEQTVRAAVPSLDGELSFILAYLANTMEKHSQSALPAAVSRMLPYSTVAAVDPGSAAFRELAHLAGIDERHWEEDDILLNEWAARDLGANVGDEIVLSYFPPDSAGRRVARVAFRLRGVAPMKGAAADPGFVPEYRGITDVRNLADWNPPFPLDLRLIRDQDEQYWDDHRTTPKAFVSLSKASRLWADRFGQVTSIRLQPFDLPAPQHLAPLGDRWAKELRSRLDPHDLGYRWDAVRRRALEASAGSTDFGGLFIGFSSFLILSSGMLVALLFRLNMERRSYEVGVLLAQGFTSRSVAALLMSEGLALALVGGLLGMIASAGYAWLMLSGLRSWWSAAVNAPFLGLHISATTLAIGFSVGVIVAAGSMVWSIRGLARRAPRGLLAGETSDARRRHHRTGRGAEWTAGASLSIAAGIVAYATLGHGDQQTLAFFLGGTAVIVGCLSALLVLLRREPQGVIQQAGAASTVWLGLRNAQRNIQRSMLTAGLIASAAFVIVSLESFRLRPEAEQGLDGGTGGFALLAESAVPLPYDLNTRAGREALGVDDPALEDEAGFKAIAFRLRGGDEASCLNLYRPTEPRVLGVPPQFIDRDGFRFAGSSAEAPGSPWTLLRSRLPGGIIPAIGDESAVRWQMQLGLGQDLVITDEHGRKARLRFVALLKNSVLQNEILIADGDFTTLFPSISGRQFFLIEAPPDRVGDVEAALERELERFGFDAATTTGRLAEFLAVQNTYLSTFQTLGGIGLLLGAAGLAAVMLRNVWERRRELALLQAVGFSKRSVAVMVLVENLVLAVAGLFCALVSSAIAVAPTIASQETVVPWDSIAVTFAGVLAVVLTMGIVALLALRETSLLQGLRRE